MSDAAPQPIAFRRAVRRFVRAECELVHDGEAREARLLDLSPSGALIRSDEAVATGERVRVRFRVPGTDERFEAHAAVARVVHGRRPGDAGRAVAVAFEDVDDLDAGFLTGALAGVPPIIPSPRRPR